MGGGSISDRGQSLACFLIFLRAFVLVGIQFLAIFIYHSTTPVQTLHVLWKALDFSPAPLNLTDQIRCIINS